MGAELKRILREWYLSWGHAAAYIAAAASLLLVWTAYVLLVGFDVDLVKTLGDKDKGTNPALLLWVAVVWTPIMLLYVWWRSRQLHRLRAGGAEADGWITAIGPKAEGQKMVVVRYDVGGVEYTTKADILEDFPEDQPVSVVYDPADPRRCEVIAVEWPQEPAKPSSDP